MGSLLRFRDTIILAFRRQRVPRIGAGGGTRLRLLAPLLIIG